MAKELTVVKSWPGADTETPSPVSDTLDLISQHESGNQNVPNYRFGPGYTAQGYYQITNTNWNKIAPLTGIDTSTYPNAMSAPKDAQAKVATYLLTQTPAGIRNWTDYNPRLRAALDAAPPQRGEAARSVDAADTLAAPAVAPAADSGSTDILGRISRGENVQVTPEDILRTAFGPTGVQIARTPAPQQPPTEAPVTVVKSWAPPPPPPPQSIGDQLKNQGFLDSAWSAIKGQLSTIKDVFTGEYSRQTAEQIKQFHELEKNGTPEQKREFAKQVVFSNIPFASTVFKATHGNLPGAAGDVAGMAALPVAAEAVPAAYGGIKTGLGAVADVARSPVAADVVGVVSPRAANVLRTFRRGANAVESIREAMADAKAKAAGTPAAETPAATPAAAQTPGQAYAESQGHDWAKLSANDRQLMEQIAQAQANVAAQTPSVSAAPAATPAPEPPATPPVAPAAPQAAPAAPEAPAATQEPSTAPVVPEAPQTLQPAAAVEKLTDYVLGKKIAPHMVDRLPPEYWQMIADDAGTAVPTLDEIAQIKANVAAKAVETPVQGEQVFETQKARIEEGMTPPKETPQESPIYPPHYEYIRQADSKMAAERAFLKDQRVADYLLSRKPPITPEEFEGMTLEDQNKLILEAPAKSAKGKHLPFLPKPEGAKVQAVGRWAEEGIRDIADTMRWRQAQTPAVAEPAAIPTEGLENTPIAGKAGFEAEKAKPAPVKRTRRAKPRGEL